MSTTRERLWGWASAPVSALAAAIVVITGCPQPDPAPTDPPPSTQSCALDLNFDTTGALPLVDGAGSGVLCPAFDQDLFAFDVAEPGTIVTVSLSMSTALSRVNPAYRLIRDDGTAEGAPTPFAADDEDRSAGEPTNFSASHRIEEAGRYFVLVFDRQFVEDAFDISNPYTVTVALAPDPDVYESNNEPPTATPLDSNVPLIGQIATTDDEDWFVIELPAATPILDLRLSAVADDDLVHEVQVYAEDAQTVVIAGVAIVDEDDPAKEALRLRTRVSSAATAYVRVKAQDGRTASAAPTASYSLTLALLEDPDENEGVASNDLATTATRVSSGTTLSAVIASTADQDQYRLSPGARSRTTPGVLIVGIEFDDVDPRDPLGFRPQVQVRSVDPEASENAQRCSAACSLCDQDVCKEVRLQRFVSASGFRTAFPLRDARDVLVIVNEFGDDAFQEGAGYSITFEVIDDPDAGEGDDVLIRNLEFAGFANEVELALQFRNSRERARVLQTTYPDDLPLIPVPEPSDQSSAANLRMVDCNAPGTEPQTVVASGRLTYEGDRDYFRVDVPAEGFWSLDFESALTGAASTAVELTLFVRAGENLIANTLETVRTQAACRATTDCPAGSICVDRQCWAERDDNLTFSSQLFPDPAADECAFVSVFNRNQRPLYLEVVDNGINDFDVDVTYRFELTIRCGCPAACDSRPGTCLGAPPPQ
jgi:hypothetical protein